MTRSYQSGSDADQSSSEEPEFTSDEHHEEQGLGKRKRGTNTQKKAKAAPQPKFYDSDSDSDAGRSFDEEPENTSDEEYTGKPQPVGGKKKRGTNTQKKAKVVPQPKYVAHVSATANDGANTSESTSKVDNVDSNILARIRKAMQLATHPGTGEAEARVAMRMANKLMQLQNLTQADLIANETAEERLTRAGQSTVTITSTQNKTVRCQRWYSSAVTAACETFDVQVYSVKTRIKRRKEPRKEPRKPKFNWIFYGLADNTVAAALAFEMLHNQIETWAIERKRELKGRAAPNSYRRGVAQRVLNDAIEEKEKALKKAEEEEKKRIKEDAAAAEAARAAEIARLSTSVAAEPTLPSPKLKEKPNAATVEDVPHEDDWMVLEDPPDDEDNSDLPPNYGQGDIISDDDLGADFDDHDDDADDLDLAARNKEVQDQTEKLDRLLMASAPPIVPTVKPKFDEPHAIKSGPLDDVTPSWASALQLRTFRDNAQAVADSYLKESGTKLSKRAKWAPIQYDHAAYTKGWDDGQKVDLKRRRIEDEDKIKIKQEE